jgi:deazaflavin-dependent oxidoreductase (nitroreductase family)
LGLGPLVGGLILLLTTTGRRSGLPRVTPLQYEEIDGKIYIGAARGEKADWVRNIRANPVVTVRVGSRRFRGLAELITDPVRIADFLEVRLRRHPRMVGMMLRAEGLAAPPTRAQLEAYAANLTMVVISPDDRGNEGVTVHTPIPRPLPPSGETPAGEGEQCSPLPFDAVANGGGVRGGGYLNAYFKESLCNPESES